MYFRMGLSDRRTFSNLRSQDLQRSSDARLMSFYSYSFISIDLKQHSMN